MAKEYIPREDVINDIGELFTICRETYPNECGHHFIVEDELQIHLDRIRNLPAADVAEVRHGRWERFYDKSAGGPRLRCSLCRSRSLYAFYFCPDCGAKMDGGRDDG